MLWITREIFLTSLPEKTVYQCYGIHCVYGCFSICYSILFRTHLSFISKNSRVLSRIWRIPWKIVITLKALVLDYLLVGTFLAPFLCLFKIPNFFKYTVKIRPSVVTSMVLTAYGEIPQNVISSLKIFFRFLPLSMWGKLERPLKSLYFRRALYYWESNAGPWGERPESWFPTVSM